MKKTIGSPIPHSATPMPRRTIEYINENTNLITDSIHRPLEDELLDPAGSGWGIVDPASALRPFFIEGESVKESDTKKESDDD